MNQLEAAQGYVRAMKEGDAAEAARFLAMIEHGKVFERQLDEALFRMYGLPIEHCK